MNSSATLTTLPSRWHVEDISEREIWEQEKDSTHFRLISYEYGLPSVAEVAGAIEEYYRKIFQAGTLVTELINMQFSSMEISMTELGLGHKIIVSELFKENFDPIIMGKCRQLISILDKYFMVKGIADTRYFLGVHDLGEDQYVEKIPYVEIRVPVSRVDELLCIWKEAIDFLGKFYSEEDLEAIDIFFTRE